MNKFCPNCNIEVETRWKFGRDRCPMCNKGLDENPIYLITDCKLGIPDRRERNRRMVVEMVNEGTISKKDLEW